MKTKKRFTRKIVIILLLFGFILPYFFTSPQKAQAEPTVDFTKLHHFHLHVYDPGDNDITEAATDGNFNVGHGAGEVGLFLFEGDANNIDHCIAYLKISGKGNWFNPGMGITYKATGKYDIRKKMTDICGPGGRVTDALNGRIWDFEELITDTWGGRGDENRKTISVKNNDGQSDDAFYLPPEPANKTYIIRAFGKEGDLPGFPDKAAVFWKTQIRFNASTDPQTGQLTLGVDGPGAQGGSTVTSVYINPSRQIDQNKIFCKGPTESDPADHRGHEMNDDSAKNEPGGSIFANIVSDPVGWNLWSYLNPITLALRIANSIAGGFLDMINGMIRGILDEMMKDWGGYLLKQPQDLYKVDAAVYGWQLTRNVCNIFFIIVFFVLLFLNLIGPYLDPYLIKKTLPRFIIAIIGVNLSLFICNEILKIANYVSAYFLDVGAAGSVWGNLVSKMENYGVNFAASWSPQAGIGDVFASLVSKFLNLFVTIGMLIGGGVSVFVFMIRIAMILLLAIISPFMFLAFAVPFGQNYAKSWWEKYMKWVFMGPVIALLIYLIYALDKMNLWAVFVK